MSKNLTRKFYILNLKKNYSFVFGSGIRFYGFDYENGSLKSFFVPFHKIFAVSDAVHRSCCCVTVDKFGFVKRVSVPGELLSYVFEKKRSNFFGGIL